MKRRVLLITLVGALLACGALFPSSPDEPRWYRGNTHTHTLWSDGDAAPELVVDWYRAHGYDFLALSDHNVLARTETWKAIKETGHVTPARVAALATAFGDDWLEVRTRADGTEEMRLKTLTELRERFETDDFRMITGEELSDGFLEVPVHINGLNLDELVLPQGGTTLVETMQRNFDAIREQGERLGRPVLAHLNHPNFYWAFTPEDIARLRGERFFEVYNGHPSVNNRGDDAHHSTDAMWDTALTLRLTELDLGLLYGVAVDDAHDYFESGLGHSNPGRGWIMVRAAELEADSLIEAMNDGDFYASSGVLLEDVIVAPQSLTVHVAAEAELEYTTTFIGTRWAPDGHGLMGERLYRTTENPARYEFEGDELYVRAKVISSRPHPNPAQEGERECAWVQPVIVGKR